MTRMHAAPPPVDGNETGSFPRRELTLSARLHAVTTLTLLPRTQGGPNAQGPCADDRHDRICSSVVAGARPGILRRLRKGGPPPALLKRRAGGGRARAGRVDTHRES